MNKTKEILISNCEKDFIISCFKEKQRIDLRSSFDFRNVHLQFGLHYGSCQAYFGKTRVFAQVHGEIGIPRHSRPKDGIIHVNVELSPMASPCFESGRMSDEGVEINRLLERCIKESHMVDTESLCIISGEKVWVLRVTVTVLNHDGNMLDCACLAAMAALAHYRRNELSVDHKIITILPHEDKKPIPLTIIHIPLCVTFAFFSHGEVMLMDPCEREERVMEGRLVVCVNKHREVCTLQATGSTYLLPTQVLRCINIAVSKVKYLVQLVETALAEDTKRRTTGVRVNFSKKFTPTRQRKSATEDANKNIANNETVSETLNSETADTIKNDDDGSDDLIEMQEELVAKKDDQPEKPIPSSQKHESDESSGSEEELVLLNDADFQISKSSDLKMDVSSEIASTSSATNSNQNSVPQSSNLNIGHTKTNMETESQWSQQTAISQQTSKKKMSKHKRRKKNKK